jgi:hypothetical protein
VPSIDPHKYKEIDGFLRLSSSRSSTRTEPSYRAITLSNDNPDTDSEISSRSQDGDDRDDSGDDSDALVLTSHQETLKLLDHRIASQPSSVETWLLLLSHTLSTIPITSKNATKARCEITLSILGRALAADTRNGASKELRLTYMKAGEEVWHESKIKAEWEDALKVGGIEIQIEWLEWKIGKGNKGIDGIIEDAARISGMLGHGQEDEVAKLRIFWRVAVAFQKAGVFLSRLVLLAVINNEFSIGFTERATAMFQAQAELCVYLFSTLS